MKFAVRTLLLATALSVTIPASAGTLREALQKAYATNPTLTGARAQQRANDENAPINRSRGLPNLSASAGFTDNLERSSPLSPVRQATAGLSLSVPIYQGGAVKNGIRSADARIEAGRANLRDTEASLFSQVVGAYMDVIRDQAIVQLQRANVGVLTVNLEATKDRFQVGDLTRTDVAQSQARLALAKSQYQSAQSQLAVRQQRVRRELGRFQTRSKLSSGGSGGRQGGASVLYRLISHCFILLRFLLFKREWQNSAEAAGFWPARSWRRSPRGDRLAQ